MIQCDGCGEIVAVVWACPNCGEETCKMCARDFIDSVPGVTPCMNCGEDESEQEGMENG